MKYTIIPVFFYILSGFSNPLQAQLIPLQNYTVKNGLPSNVINDIEQDQQGYIWLATQVGAVKFDGYNFTVFSSKQGIPGKTIKDILIAADSSIWIGTENGGIARIHNHQVSVINTSEGLISNHVLKLFEDKEKNIWCITNGGVSVIGKHNIMNFDTSNSPLNDRVLCHYIDHNGTVWLTTVDGVYTLNKNKLHTYRNKVLKDAIVRDIVQDSTGSLWFATQDKGVIKITPDQKTISFNKKTGIGTNITLSLCCLRNNNILVGTYYGGIYEIRNNKIVHRWRKNIDDLVIWQFLEDKRGRIWIRTNSNGVLLMHDNKIQQIDKNNGLVNDQLTKIFRDSNGDLWFPTQNGLSMYGKVIFQIYNQGLIDNETSIQSIQQINGKLFLGTHAGLNVLNPDGKITPYPLNESRMYSPSIFSISQINNCKWLGIEKGMVKICGSSCSYLKDNDLFQTGSYPIFPNDIKYYRGKIICATKIGLIAYQNNIYHKISNPGISWQNSQVWSMKKGPHGKLWCASEDGLLIYDGNKFERYTTNNGLPSNNCVDIDFDPDSILWLATDKGVSRIKILKHEKIDCKNFGIKEGLQSEDISLIISDNKGFTWVGHNKGLDRIDQHTFSIKHYSSADGFLPVETYIDAVTMTDDGEIWFGTVDGAVRYIPSNDIENRSPPKTYITAVSLLNDTTPISHYARKINAATGLPEELSLPYYKNNLVFNFVGLHYTVVKKNRYRYKLEGFDTEWSRPEHEIQALYRKLPPGKYTFELLASNCDEVWIKQPVKFSFEIRPPFYNTWWFYLLEASALILALIVYIRLRERKLRRDKQILSQRVKERTLEVEMQRDQIALQKEEITDSIRYAQRIQSAVLPKTEIMDSLLPEYFVLFKPRDIVSGDFYWINNRGKKIIVLAADCTGHGVPGAFMSMLGVSILNEITSSINLIESGKILDTLRDHLTSTLWQTGKEQDAKDGMDLALCVIDQENKQLYFSGAYNPLVIVRKGEVILYKGDKMPVGFHIGKMHPFTTHKINIEAGDCLYIFSDGYQDQFGGPDGKKFKAIAFRNLLLDIHEKPMEEQKEILNETFHQWMGINEQVDDILVIGIRIN